MDYGGTPMVIADDDSLAIALSIKGITGGLKFFAKLTVVIDFAIERKRIAVGLSLRAPLKWLV